MSGSIDFSAPQVKNLVYHEINIGFSVQQAKKLVYHERNIGFSAPQAKILGLSKPCATGSKPPLGVGGCPGLLNEASFITAFLTKRSPMGRDTLSGVLKRIESITGTDTSASYSMSHPEHLTLCCIHSYRRGRAVNGHFPKTS